MSAKKVVAVVGGVLLLLLVIAVVIVYRDWPTNHAKRLVSAAEKADTVKIYRLQGLPDQLTTGDFPILPYNYEHQTFGDHELRGTELKSFSELWAKFPLNSTGGAMCHFPVYGFRFYRKDKLIFQTTLCWACENFYVDTVYFGSNWIGFDSGAEAGQQLLGFCDALLPYDRGYQERIAKEREALMEAHRSTGME